MHHDLKTISQLGPYNLSKNMRFCLSMRDIIYRSKQLHLLFISCLLNVSSFLPVARTGDQLAKDVFHDAGVQLAQHVRAALYYYVMDSMSSNQNLTVVCCGSVFKSWDLIRDGFKDFLKPSEDSKWTGTLELVQLKHSAAYGAARLSVHFDSKVTIPIDSGVQFDKILFGVNF
ncbi:unnamed protein product [Schistosoma intercalatum]|nr:unnamed protein product [Schistosoma intercalatum]CAH8553102.1 unnamed protein product [Schistosoma intercalatum]